ncbi:MULTISPECIES: DUF881 domain-containing protein [unclassified Clostridium]|uniref:DUF881 domain-containing protein n=1 Tax=unclassified Clostridium TaxID=2614128 RepID=UPI00189AB0D6|nr:MULTISPECIES: DUF881 domain-containing protein [unclassified Clostridium]MBP3915148.1 DUF881 domain-containing protein [Clostridium sp.]MEE0932751.1 DUF881 domain-containing protein [Clostridium sp.]
MKKVLSQLVVAIVCAFLGFLLTYQFKQLSVANSGDIDYDSADILSEIEILKKEKEDLQKNNEILSEELKQLEDAAAREGEIEGEIKKQLDNVRMQIGLLDVKGPGVVITLALKNSVFGTNGTQTVNTVSEEEIINLINSLWYAGAEAISINEMRITPQTGIKMAGSSISIGSAGRVDPNSEIVIKAIGDKNKLNLAVNFPGVLDYGALKSYSSDVKQIDDITIVKTTQSLRYEYIKPVQ